MIVVNRKQISKVFKLDSTT